MAEIIFLQHLRNAGHLRDSFNSKMASFGRIDRQMYAFVEGSVSRQLLRCAVQIVRWQKREASEEHRAALDKFMDGLDQHVPHNAPEELEELANWVGVELSQLRVMEHRINEQLGLDFSDLEPIVRDEIKHLCTSLAEGDAALAQKTERLCDAIDSTVIGRKPDKPGRRFQGDVARDLARELIEWEMGESKSTDWGLGMIRESRDSLKMVKDFDTSDCLWILDLLEDTIETLQTDIRALHRFSQIEAEDNPVYGSWIKTGVSTQRADRLCAIYSTLYDIEGLRLALFFDVTDFRARSDDLGPDFEPTLAELGMFLGDLEHLALRDLQGAMD